nr:hypothetical protein [Faustovirus mariensis]
MSMIIATNTGYNVEFNVLNVNSSSKLGFGQAALYVPYEQLPRHEGMVKLGGSAVIGKHNGKLAYSISLNIDSFLQAVQVGKDVASFDNNVVIEDKEWNISVIDLVVGKSIWFIDNKAVYECGVIGIFDPVEGECKDKLTVNTSDLLEYVEFTFPNEFKVKENPELIVNESSQVTTTEREIEDLMKDLNQLNDSVNQLAQVIPNLSIANDTIEASVNTDNMLASEKPSAPLMEQVIEATNGNVGVVAEPMPECEHILVGLQQVDTLNESYVLETPTTDVELALAKPILKRAVNKLGLKCWKANYQGDVRLKLTFDKIIPECELRLVRIYEDGQILVGDRVTPIRSDKQYDSVRANVGNNEYIHFTANGVYIDVMITSVEFEE